MRVLLINTYPSGGGAAVACQRSAALLRAAGAEVRLLTSVPFGFRHTSAFVAERWDTFRTVGYRRDSLFRFSTASEGVALAHHPWVAWADVIHLHWVQQGLLSLRGLRALLQLEEKRFFWTLHDFWPLTGGCHIPYLIDGAGATSFCHRYEQHCGSCPLLGARVEQDRAYRLFERKAALSLQRLHLVAVSQAMVEAARQSPLFRGSPITLLHNSIDLGRFAPVEGDGERVPGRLLLVAARIDDPVKGPDLLLQMLDRYQQLPARPEVELTLVGRIKDKSLLEKLPIKWCHIERAEGEQLVRLYQEASLVLSTSRYETLGQTLLEGVACGTPALAFRVGGIPDVIRPREGNGQLVPPYDTDLMAKELRCLLCQTPDPSVIAATASPFGNEAVTAQLLHLYSGSQ